MKKLILSAVLMAFAVATYAGESCDGSSCCSKAKATQTKTSTGTCTSASASACTSTQKTFTKKSKNGSSKQALQSPKAMSLASR